MKYWRIPKGGEGLSIDIRKFGNSDGWKGLKWAM